jgi:soluble lytic murein transglycosylase
MQSPSRSGAAVLRSRLRRTAAGGLALAVVAAGAAADPRPELTELRFAGRTVEALARIDAVIAEDPETAARWGLSYLRGHLLEQLGRPHDAAEAFARAMADTPALEPYARYRLAAIQEAGGHPEVAAGLIAEVVAAPPRHLAAEAARMLQRSLAAGGDCRLLSPSAGSRLAGPERRMVELAVADCALRAGEIERSRGLYIRLISDQLEDDVARLAAERLDHLHRRNGSRPPAAEAVRIAMGFHQHRRFDLAIEYLGPVVARHPTSLSEGRFDEAYALARAHFWRDDFTVAVGAFGRLAAAATRPHQKAQARFQQGRSFELAGSWKAAEGAYRYAYAADPAGGWAASSLYAALRLAWRYGNEAEGERLHGVLAAQRRWLDTTARAALFLAASDLVRSRSERAGPWLDLAERGGRDTAIEVAYWRGRLAELEGEPEAAVRRYLQVLHLDAFHPIGEAARERLAGAGIAPAARAEGVRLAASQRTDDLYSAWLLLGEASPWGRAAHGRVRTRWEAAAAGTALVQVPPRSWPLWRQPLTSPEEILLALGVWEEGAPAVGEHFPIASPALAFTAAGYLRRAGRVRHSIRIAEILERRLPAHMPPAVQPADLRRLLYPNAHGGLVHAHAGAHGIDPNLLAAIIREESRYDERALSNASARGLTQFVQPTAERIGRGIGLERLSADDLYRPEVAIRLGAAYLGELTRSFRESDHQAVAAYNAGAHQALLWRSYCFSPEPAEYFTKVNFSQTRGYLEKVLRSRAHYRDVHGAAF